MPADDVTRIRYFTARIKADDDEEAPVRQSAYLRALETVPNLEIHEGRYFKIFKKGKLTAYCKRPDLPGNKPVSRAQSRDLVASAGERGLSTPLETRGDSWRPNFFAHRCIDPKLPNVDIATTRTWEEKSSDVCLATHLVADGFRGDYEQVVVISNDSDLVDPISLVRTELRLPLHVLSPHSLSSKPSFHVQQVASSYSLVDRSLLTYCQFPESLPDREGRRIYKPEAWERSHAGCGEARSLSGS